MPNGHYAEIGEEVVRLLDLLLDLLTRQSATENLVRDHDPDTERLMDASEVARWKGVLTGEKAKVKDLETVVAVVGTVKAGKSSTINAIIGSDILPNRADPMTTYPTLVRHDEACSEPVLDFPLADDFSALAAKARELLMKALDRGPLEELLPDKRDRAAAESLLQGRFNTFPRYTEGRKNIQDLLTQINDLGRLAAAKCIQIDLPASEDAGSPMLPVIRVAFHHVKDVPTEGRLAILDSPGPNEAKQGERLRNIVIDQLARASAVILVSDYTQMKTDSTEELQDLIAKFQENLRKRIFIFVNKFDQRTRADWGIEEVKEQISKRLNAMKVTSDRIYPVSGLFAFYANWALREISIRGQLPEPGDQAHTEDFAKRAMGFMWEDKIENIDEVDESAKRMWKASLFDAPLDQVVRMAAANAALISLRSATAKGVQCGRTVDAFLKIRNSGATKDALAIEAAISALEQDLMRARSARSIANEALEQNIKEFNEYVDQVTTKAARDLEKSIDTFFDHGTVHKKEKYIIERNSSAHKIREAALDIKSKIQKGAKSLQDIFRTPTELLDDSEQSTNARDQAVQVFNPRSLPQFEGSNRYEEARKFVAQITSELELVFHKANNRLGDALEHAVVALSELVQSRVIEELGPVLEEAKTRLQDEFDLRLEPPQPEIAQGFSGLREITTTKTFRASTEWRTRYEKRDGLLEGVKRWFADLFNKSWGYEKITTSHEVLRIDLSQITREILIQLGQFKEKSRTVAETYVHIEIRGSFTKYFDSLNKYLSRFRGDLSDALADQKMKAEDLRNLHESIVQFQNELDEILLDIENIDQGLQEPQQ